MDKFSIVSNYIKWVNTSWTCSTAQVILIMLINEKFTLSRQALDFTVSGVKQFWAKIKHNVRYPRKKAYYCCKNFPNLFLIKKL